MKISTKQNFQRNFFFVSKVSPKFSSVVDSLPMAMRVPQPTVKPSILHHKPQLAKVCQVFPRLSFKLSEDWDSKKTPSFVEDNTIIRIIIFALL